MEKDNKYLMEQELMEAYTYAEDADIGMPDVEAELLLVRRKAAMHTRNSSALARMASVAAGIVVMLALGWSVSSYINQDDGTGFCVAYVAGKRITNEQQVLDMMSADIMNMNCESGIIDIQLNDFFNE